MQLVRLKDLSEMTNFSRSFIYKLIAVHQFPAPVKIGAASVWLEEDIVNWLKAHFSMETK
jgi:prophage regulatory protein